MQRAVNLTINGVVIAMEAYSDEEEQVLRSAGKHLEETISMYCQRFPDLPMQELLVRVALEMAYNAQSAQSELKKINDECQNLRKDLLSF